MESQPLPPQETTETGEPGPSSEAPAYKNAKVWKDLENETGFASCADYLEFYQDVRPDFEGLLRDFRRLPEVPHVMSISIYDLSTKENLPVSIRPRRHCHSGTELIQALREPPANVCVQLVLAPFSSFALNQEMGDALVLGLKLDPQILEDTHIVTISIVRPDQYPRKGFRSSQIHTVIGNETVAVLSLEFMPEGTNSVPVVLVLSDRFKFGREGTFGNILAADHETPPIRRSALGESMSFSEMGNDVLEQKWRPYARSVQQFISQGRSANPSKAFPLLAATSPLFYIEACRVREAFNDVGGTYATLTGKRIPHWDYYSTDGKDLNSALYTQRLTLRRTLEEAEDYASQLFSHLSSQVAFDWSEEPSYGSLQADFRSLIDEARRLETEIRDYMQLEAGNLSLEESRRSIDLSNLQIRESKSGRFLQRGLRRFTLTCRSKDLSVPRDVSGR